MGATNFAFNEEPVTTLSYSANDAGTGGTLTVSDGANTAHIALDGQYTTAGFEGGYDQGSGTAVAYDAAHESGNFDQLVLGGRAEGDKIDLQALLDTHFNSGGNIDDFVKVTQDGSHVTVAVDTNGTAGGANWENVCILDDYGTSGGSIDDTDRWNRSSFDGVMEENGDRFQICPHFLEKTDRRWRMNLPRRFCFMAGLSLPQKIH